MDNPQKFSNSKDVLAFLVETFPECFSLEGEAKPLKIGVFQDLVEELKEDARISKTLLRSTLRHYTNSWRYLHSIKEGVQRVDLQGNGGDKIELEHAQHAAKQLQESKAKVAEKRKEQQKLKSEEQRKFKKSAAVPGKSAPRGTKPNNPRPKRKLPPPEKLSHGHLVEGTAVTVKVGKVPMAATIKSVAKDGVQVQLDSGMVVKVPAENLRLARAER